MSTSKGNLLVPFEASRDLRGEGVEEIVDQAFIATLDDGATQVIPSNGGNDGEISPLTLSEPINEVARVDLNDDEEEELLGSGSLRVVDEDEDEDEVRRRMPGFARYLLACSMLALLNASNVGLGRGLARGRGRG